MTIAQQARDATAIIKAIGNDKAIIFGSSGGGIISLELAAVDFIATLVGAPDIPYPQ